MKGSKIILFVLFILIIDQALKFWIKTTMVLGEEFAVLGLPWFKIHFVENEGMAFGLELGGDYGKLILSLFRIIAVFFIGLFLRSLLQKKEIRWGFVISVALILAGAIGNIIDSAFYGLIFSDSLGRVAEMMPSDGGYSKFLHGHVVDMLYFPLYEGFLPEWIPFWGGDFFIFFRPVFNIADSAITLGVLSIILFQRSFFLESAFEDEGKTTDNEVVTNYELEVNDSNA